MYVCYKIIWFYMNKILFSIVGYFFIDLILLNYRFISYIDVYFFKKWVKILFFKFRGIIFNFIKG